MLRPNGVHYSDPLNVAFRRLKDMCGWTAVDIARHLDISSAVISQYVHGHTRPSVMAVKAFEPVLSDAGAGGATVPVIPRTGARNDEQRKQQAAVLRRIRGKAAALAEEIGKYLEADRL